MLSHLSVSGKRETASRSDTMKMFIDRIAKNNKKTMKTWFLPSRVFICFILLCAGLQPTVDRAVEKQKSFQNGHVVVELRRMGLKLFVVVGGKKASGPTAMVVQRDTFTGVLAQIVWTPVTVFLETMLFLKQRFKSLY